jgi:hypothetical protein
MDVLGDAVLVEELVKLLVVDAMGSFDFAVQVESAAGSVISI